MARIISEHLDEETVVQWLNKREWTPLAAACLVYGVKPIDVPDKELLAEWDTLSFLSRRVRDALRLFAYWKSHLMSSGLVQPPLFLAWCRFKNVDISEFLASVNQFAPDLYKRLDPSQYGDREAIGHLYSTYAGLFSADEWGYQRPERATEGPWDSAPKPRSRTKADTSAGDSSMLPQAVDAVPQPGTESDTSSRDGSMSGAADGQPWKGIQTRVIVNLFAKKTLSEEEQRKWNRTFSNPPQGLKESARIEKKPAQGVEAHWNPVAVASWLHTVRKRRLRELDEIFLKKQDLEAWRSDWEKESDRLRSRSGFIG